MRTLTARPALRWLVPLVVLLVVLAGFLVSTRANADPTLPTLTPEQLLEHVSDAKVDGLSGTVVQSADLGIPALPGGSGSAGDKLTSLLAGSHTMDVYYGAPDKARVAIRDPYAETDVISNGADVWTYDSRARAATHTTRAAADAAAQPDRTAPAGTPATPQDLAKELLARVNSTTDVGVDPVQTVAGRPAYDLVLTPRDPGSLISQVRIAVDGTNFLPLRVRVFDADNKVALDVAYDKIVFAQPEAQMFAFNPPAGTKVTQQAAPEHKAPTAAQKKDLESRKVQAQKDTTTVGSGWTTVVITKVPSDATSSNATLSTYLEHLPVVSGSWGSGHILQGTILTAILTNDGRLAVGAVSKEAVSSALAR